MVHYIYLYLDPRKPGRYKYGEYKFDYEPFYVGKGKGYRWKQKKNRYCERIINKIKELGLEPIVIKIKENMLESDSFILERRLIELIGRKDLNKGPLINFTNGGEGSSGVIVSQKTKLLMSKNNKGFNNPFYGKRHSSKTKNKLSLNKIGKYIGRDNPFYGKHHSEETKIKISSENKGKVRTEEFKKNISKINKGRNYGENSSNHKLTEDDVIKILEYLKNGNLTQKEIADKFNVHQTRISHIKLRRNWKYVTEGQK